MQPLLKGGPKRFKVFFGCFFWTISDVLETICLIHFTDFDPDCGSKAPNLWKF